MYLQLDLDAMEKFRALAHLLRGAWRSLLAIKPERLNPYVLEGWHCIGNAVRGGDPVVLVYPRVASGRRLGQENGVRGLNGDVVVEVVEGCQEERRGGEVGTRVWRVLRLGKVVHADVDPGDEVGLRDVLAVEELVEVYRGRAGQVEVPLRGGRWLGLLAF